MQPHRSPNTPADWREIPDEPLLRRAARGEAAAVDAFVLRFGDRLCSYLVRIVRDRAFADDLVQEAFVRVLQDAHRYDPEWPVAVWLFRIARNLALDLLRREGTQRRHVDSLSDAGPAFAPAAVTTAEHREFQVELERALQRLAEPFRSVFLLRDGEGLSYEQIAAVLAISPKTVSSRLHRAREQLRMLLEEHLER